MLFCRFYQHVENGHLLLKTWSRNNSLLSIGLLAESGYSGLGFWAMRPDGHAKEIIMSNIIWIIVIGFVAGLIARFLSPGPNSPKGFLLTTVLGVVGAFVATFIGQTVGWYRLDQGAGLVGATVGSILVLFIWNRLVAHHVLKDPGNARDRNDTLQRHRL
jgi:uncharacterized membrane protein YeaQ/YmgE (transglycosylase-associated protein family)